MKPFSNHTNDKNENIAKRLFPFVKNVFEREGDKFQTIGITFTDGIKNLNLGVNIKKAIETKGKEVTSEFEKGSDPCHDR